MDYLKLLRDGYVAEKNSREVDSRLEYLSDEIFNFTTYDSEMAELFASKAIEVCLAISGGITFEYIKDTENYKWYLLMCNMPFFAKRIEWGTSIRGAWWDYSTTYHSCGLYDGDRQIIEEMQFTTDQWKEFIGAIAAFAQEAALVYHPFSPE